MSFQYSAERNVQILVALLKAHGIKKVVASPGTTNLNFVASLQHDGSFEMYSAVDERGAAYMAVGMAYESGEPVVITCTGATASRNYLPALTEAYHRKLPVLAVTATQDMSNRGNLSPQFVDRTEHPSESVVLSVTLPYIHEGDELEEWRANLDVNRALLALRNSAYGGGAPSVHINLITRYDNDFSVKELPPQRVIRKYTVKDSWPQLPDGRIAVTVGGHAEWTPELTKAADDFCAHNDAVIFTDHSSGYRGKYAVHATLPASQEMSESDIFDVDLLIHMGEETGDYMQMPKFKRAKEVWRVSEDGELRDTFHKLTKVFQIPEQIFFEAYTDEDSPVYDDYYRQCQADIQDVKDSIPDLPFSNIWLAQNIAPNIPEGSYVHLGVSNTMRAWTFFDFQESVHSIANVGCRGIDGALPTVVGMSQVHPDRLHFCALGDLTFFYGFNALGNRHVGRNLRVLLVNNGRGTEFRLYIHRAQIIMGDEADPYSAAAGHSGNKSPDLVRHYAEDLGFEYLTASDKDSATSAIERFLTPELTDRPMLFEAFTDSIDESEALRLIRAIRKTYKGMATAGVKRAVKRFVGANGVAAIKKFMKK